MASHLCKQLAAADWNCTSVTQECSSKHIPTTCLYNCDFKFLENNSAGKMLYFLLMRWQTFYVDCDWCCGTNWVRLWDTKTGVKSEVQTRSLSWMVPLCHGLMHHRLLWITIKQAFFKYILLIYIMNISCYQLSALVQVMLMAYCWQATIHHLSHCRLSFRMSLPKRY